MTPQEIENLLIDKIKALEDDNKQKLFDRVTNMTSSEYEEMFSDDDNAVAFVGFVEDKYTGSKPRLIINEIYQVIVAVRKRGGDTYGKPHTLCTSVRDLIHGQIWDNYDITPFEYTGRQLIEYKGEIVAYAMNFSLNNILHVPTP